MKPIIGVTACSRMIDVTTDIHHVVFCAYTNFVQKTLDSVPLIIPSMDQPLTRGEMKAMLSRVDGVVLTGSPSNVGVRKVGDRFGAVCAEGTIDPHRDANSMLLISTAYEMKIPLLGICRGCQEINVAFGGDLYQAVHTVKGRFDHRAPKVGNYREKYESRHSLTVVESSWTESQIPRNSPRSGFQVNSLHSQAISELGDGLTIEAVADDSTVEAIRHKDHPFLYGVQWHLEWQKSAIDGVLAKAFRNSCKEFNVSREEKLWRLEAM